MRGPCQRRFNSNSGIRCSNHDCRRLLSPRLSKLTQQFQIASVARCQSVVAYGAARLYRISLVSPYSVLLWNVYWRRSADFTLRRGSGGFQCSPFGTYDRVCVKTQLSFHLSRGWARVLRVVDEIEIDRNQRSNLAFPRARKRVQFDQKRPRGLKLQAFGSISWVSLHREC